MFLELDHSKGDNMSIASEITRLQTAKSDLKTAIENKGVTVSSSALISEYAGLVDDIPTGGGVVEKTVNFIDFDGTMLYSYTGAQAQALTELPAAPDHSNDEVPLTFDAWNWTLAEIKTYNTSYPDATIWVGANYHTTDGTYHLIYQVDAGDKITITTSTSNMSWSVDWDDGTTETPGYTTSFSHIYSSAGKYDVKVSRTGPYHSNLTNIGGDKVIEYYEPLDSWQLPEFRNTINLEKMCFTGSASSNRSITSVGSNSLIGYLFELKGLVIPRTDGIISMYGVFTEIHISLPTTAQLKSVGNSNINSITVPSATTGDSTNLFYWCKNLKTVILPSSILGYAYSFIGCNLKTLTLPSSWTNTGNPFGNSSTPTSLYELNFGSNFSTPISISYVNALKKIEIPQGMTNFGTITNCSNLEKIILPSSFTTTIYNQFSDNGSLVSINLVEGITNIADKCFNKDYNLQISLLPSTLETIGASSFYNCYAMNQPLTLPSGVTNIGNSAFYGCRFTSITILATNPPTLGTTVFNTSYLTKIYIPNGTLSAYQSASNWSDYASYMEELPE